MFRISRNRAIFLAATAVILTAGAFLFFETRPLYSEALSVAEGAATFEELQERLERIAEEKGGAYAFEVLRRAELPPNTDLHLLGHTVGDQLYLQKGVDGIADCTPDFRNACSHSIVIGTLNEFGGEPALAKIRAACEKAPGGSGAYTMCYHGLGHGVFSFYGYSFPETVELCEQTGTEEYRDREAIECIGGAVMELSGGGGHDPELWEEAREKYLTGPLMPCMISLIPDNARSQCLIYITPEIWSHVGIELGHPDPELYDEAFAVCDTLSDNRLRHACFGGFGKEFVPLALGRDIREVDAWGARETALVEEWCAKAEVEDGIAACMSQAVQSLFWGGESDPQITFRFCDGIARSDIRAMCYYELGSAINSFIHEPEEYTRLCNQLPEEEARRCIASKNRG